MGSREQTGDVLRLIDRTLTLMSAVDPRDPDFIVKMEVVRLGRVCETLRQNALGAYDSGTDGQEILLHVHDAFEVFLKGPIGNLSAVNQMKVFFQAFETYRSIYDSLPPLKRLTPSRDVYVKGMYGSLKDVLKIYSEEKKTKS